MKKLFSAFLCLMMLAVLPVTAFAAGREPGYHHNHNNHKPSYHYSCAVSGHKFSKFSRGKVIKPTCTEKGYLLKTCTVCKKDIKVDSKPATGHKYNRGVVTKPTCTENGYITKTCKVCKDTIKVNYKPATDHKFGWGKVIKPTCTEKGYTVKECKTCDKTVKFNYKPATGHNYDRGVVTKATCTEGGFTTKTCKNKNCNETLIVKRTEALGHDKTGAAATCTTAQICARKGCNAELVAALGHDATGAAATCTTAQVCARPNCDEILAAATDHNYEVVREEPATCLLPKYVWEKCTNCGNEKNGEVGTAKGAHSDDTHTTTVEADCSTEGSIKYHCNDCNEVLSEEVLPKNDRHYFHNGTCLKCGAQEACQHEYEVVKEEPATCLLPKYVWEKCSKCGNEKNGEVGTAKGAHSDDTHTTTVEADCSTEGSIKYHCNDCNEVLSEEVLPKNDRHYFYNGKCLKCGAEDKPCEHTKTVADILEANCSAEGYSKVICDACKTVISEEILPKNDFHFFYNGKCLKCGAEEKCNHDYEVVKEEAATCTMPKYVWEKCSKCGDEKNGEVGTPDASAHSYEVVKEEPATCTMPKYVWEKCAECGNEKNGEVGTPDASAHSYEVVKEEPATCLLPKYVWEKCTECGDEKNGEVGEAKGTHSDLTYTDTLEANCSAEGYTKVRCMDCGEVLSEEILPKNDFHYFYNGTCMKCGAEEECQHTGGKNTVYTGPDCLGQTKIVTCGACGEELDREQLAPTADHWYINGTCIYGCGYPEATECAHDLVYYGICADCNQYVG